MNIHRIMVTYWWKHPVGEWLHAWDNTLLFVNTLGISVEISFSLVYKFAAMIVRVQNYVYKCFILKSNSLSFRNWQIESANSFSYYQYFSKIKIQEWLVTQSNSHHISLLKPIHMLNYIIKRHSAIYVTCLTQQMMCNFY